MKQLPLFSLSKSKSYGGQMKGRRKTARPLDKKRLHHVILKSQYAKGGRSFKKFDMQIKYKNLIYSKAKKYGIRIAAYSNVGNHFHLLIRFQDRNLIKTFFRVVAGVIARLAVGAQKGKRFGRFWDSVIFSRIVSKGRDEIRMFDYLEANLIQSHFGKAARKHFESICKEYWKEFFRTSRAPG